MVKELGAFGVVGAACFVLDVGLFQLLYTQTALDAVAAKLASTLVAMTVAYVAHRHWSFAHRAHTGVRREYLLFAVVNGATLVLGLLVVAVVRHVLHQDDPLVLQAANVASIGLGTLLRFLGYRRWVFPAEPTGVPAPEAPAPAQPPPLSHAPQPPRAGARTRGGPR
ncbi:GtrA family protein [Modestobacter roseus]|nr:GtrA family protein [Modestobacter roseus]